MNYDSVMKRHIHEIKLCHSEKIKDHAMLELYESYYISN